MGALGVNFRFCRWQHSRHGHDGDVEEIACRVHAAIVAREWDTVRLLLHPYLHWTDSRGSQVRGRTKVMAMLQQAAEPPAVPASVELRDGQIYRWAG